MVIESLTPDVGGVGLVARGLLSFGGASEGCGGGVASWRSSRRTYEPAKISAAVHYLNLNSSSPTFAHLDYILRSFWPS